MPRQRPYGEPRAPAGQTYFDFRGDDRARLLGLASLLNVRNMGLAAGGAFVKSLIDL